LTTYALAPDEVRALPNEDRHQYIEKMSIDYPRFTLVLDRMDKAYKRAPYAAEPPCVAIGGERGVGKTTLQKKMLRRHPIIKNKAGIIRPILYVLVPPRPTLPRFCVAILSAYRNRQKPSKITRTLMEPKIDELIDDYKTRQIQFDDVHHLIERLGQDVLYETCDLIKNIIKSHPVSCVLAGLPEETRQLLNANEQLGQLFGDPIVLEPFKWDNLKEFQQYLFLVEEQLPLQERSHLTSEELAKRCFIACDGNMRWLMALIREAGHLALDSHKEKLDIEILSAVYDERLAPERRGVRNPFSGDLPDYIPPENRPKPPMPRGTNRRGKARKERQERLRDIY
jgi:hypothetical protein